MPLRVYVRINPYKGDKMDIYRISVEEVGTDSWGESLKAGQTVKIVRTVTYEYELYVSDFLGGTDEMGNTPRSDISLGNLISDERDNADIPDDADILDDMVIAYEIS
jgi:hypothetical protein